MNKPDEEPTNKTSIENDNDSDNQFDQMLKLKSNRNKNWQHNYVSQDMEKLSLFRTNET